MLLLCEGKLFSTEASTHVRVAGPSFGGQIEVLGWFVAADDAFSVDDLQGQLEDDGTMLSPRQLQVEPLRAAESVAPQNGALHSVTHGAVLVLVDESRGAVGDGWKESVACRTVGLDIRGGFVRCQPVFRASRDHPVGFSYTDTDGLVLLEEEVFRSQTLQVVQSWRVISTR